MYGEGGAEKVLGQALADAFRASDVNREDVFVVSKVYPHNAGRAGVPAACDRSRRRLGLDAIDVYLLHWRGSVPLAETVDAFEAVKAQGAIREWGVSNFDIDDLIELEGLDAPDADGEDRQAALRDEPGLLRARRTRRRVQPADLPAHAAHADDGVLPARPRARSRPTRTLQAIASARGVRPRRSRSRGYCGIRT